MKKNTKKTPVVSKKKTKPAKRKKQLFNFVVNREERRAIKKKAALYTRGNASAWVKYAALKHEVPSRLRRDLVAEEVQPEAQAS